MTKTMLEAPNQCREAALNPSSLVLTYHTIAAQPSKYIYSASCTQFAEHLALISEQASKKGKHQTEVTFDDGRLSDWEFALPALQEYGVRATFFVTAGLIGNEEGYMSWAQVQELASLGHSVQSHGWSHLLLNRAESEELKDEVEWSKKEIEDRIGSRVTSISLPGGRWDGKTLDACVAAGYERVYHSDPWRKPEQRGEMYFIGRLMIRNSMGRKRLKALIHRHRPTLFYYHAQHRLKETGKQLIGDQAYHRIWRGVGAIARKLDPS